MDIDKILERVADVALRDLIKRQIQIQNETIENLNDLVISQREKMALLEAQIQGLKQQRSSSPVGLERDLFESDGVLWNREIVNGQAIFRPHCPQCQSALNRVVDFLECNKCGFSELVSTKKPSKIPD